MPFGCARIRPDIRGACLVFVSKGDNCRLTIAPGVFPPVFNVKITFEKRFILLKNLLFVLCLQCFG